MKVYFSDAFAMGASCVLLIGSDSPTLPVSYVRQAFELLRRHPVVLGPTEDGGYYLVGAAARCPQLFDDISWSTSEVWRQTTNKLHKLNITFATLPTWYDVDDVVDLRRLARELRANPLAAAELQPLCVAVEQALAKV